MDTILAATANGQLVQALDTACGAQGGPSPHVRRRRVVPLGSIEEAERLLSRECGVALVDASCDFALDIMRKIKVDGLNGVARMPVILLSEDGASAHAGSDFEILPEERVAATAGAETIARLVEEVMERRARRRRLFVQELTIEFATTNDNIERAGEIFDGLMAAAGFDETSQVALSTTFRECVGNAAEHGNHHDSRKKIRVLYLRDDEKICFVVTDEGQGFDHKAFLVRVDEVSALDHTRSRRANEKRPGGLGGFIMKKTCDRIAFNDRGNSILLMKYLPGHGKQPQV
ncbi:ATP-binding protein [bacterium]|nr:ATP-binding protein [bacterium]